MGDRCVGRTDRMKAEQAACNPCYAEDGDDNVSIVQKYL